MNKKRNLLNLSAVTILILILLPLFAPKLHKGDTPKSSIRKYIYENGHPYQSFFAVIKANGEDSNYGLRYDVAWIDYDNPSGTGTIFYVKENENGNFNVSAGTGP